MPSKLNRSTFLWQCAILIASCCAVACSCKSKTTAGKLLKAEAEFIATMNRGFAAARERVSSAKPGTANGCQSAPKMTLSSYEQSGDTEVLGWFQLNEDQRADEVEKVLSVQSGILRREA